MRTGLVLGGGAARGAYEAGIVAYLREDLPKILGGHVPLDVLTGTSVGAINACFVAATNHDPATQGRRFIEAWRSLEVESVLRFGVADVFRVFREAFGKAPIRWGRGRHGGLVDPKGLEALVGKAIPWLEIGRNVRAGLVRALAVTATHVATGRTTIFVQRHEGSLPGWSSDPNVFAMHTRIGPKHALASAAIPVLFPAVSVGGNVYVDGGLRQNVPISPALRLGAERVIVISLRHVPEESAAVQVHDTTAELERKAASAPFLIGKALNALMLDHTDTDLTRLRRINQLLDAGTRAYGPGYEAVLNQALGSGRIHPMRWVRNLLIRPSEDIGGLAAAYARSPEFRARASGLAGRWLRRLADSEGRDDADLASYLLFDGGFCELLVELGRRDARALEADWVRFFAGGPTSDAEAAFLEARAAGG